MEFLDSSSSSSDLSDYEVSNGESTEAMLALNLPHTLSRPHICHFFSTQIFLHIDLEQKRYELR